MIVDSGTQELEQGGGSLQIKDRWRLRGEVT